MAKAKKNNKKSQIFEVVWYTLCALLALWGLTYIVLGIVAEAITSVDNPLLDASDTIKKLFGLGFLYWGLIILAIASVLAIIVLLINGKNTDREQEREARRAARLAHQPVQNSEPVENPEAVIDQETQE